MLIRYLRQSSSLLFCQNEFSASIRGKLFQYNRFYSSLNDSDNKNNDENGSINLSKQGNVKEGETENESTDASAADDNLSDSLDKGELLFRKKGEKGRKKKSLKTVDIIGEEMLNAVSDISKTLHKDDVTSRKKTTYDLIAKLTEYEREKYESATAGQIEEMLAAPNIQKLFDSQQASEEKTIPKFLDSRRLKRGLFALRREMFYQAKQNGYNAKAAQDIAERAVEKARERVLSRLEKATEQKLLEKERIELKESEINEKEQKFFDLAFQVADKILYPQMRSELEKEKSKEEQPIIEPDLNMPNIFAADQPSLNVFTDISALKEHSLHYWSEWDLNAARIWNQSLGPRNGFEEMIELTEKGKMWPYPIDNEYLLGDEENVTFHEHIFLEKVIAPYNLPKQGPIAHFMELVCVGLSKNPYLTAKKKREHLDWFAQYFDKKRDEIARLHEQDQLAAQNR